jgi:uncharacterized protein YbjT (DUF2867 family)
MKVLITGASGMIGSLLLSRCLDSELITHVISFVRRPVKQQHPKLTEIILSDFENYSGQEDFFKHVSVAFFCLGVYTGEVPDEQFKKITVNYAVEFAGTLEEHSPGARFCLLSGAGADRTEKSKTSFARYKGLAEKRIANLDLEFYSFRPGYIYPSEPRKEPNVGYKIMKAIYPLVKILGKRFSITSAELADAMFAAGISGAHKEILENQDILKIKINQR